MIYHKILNNYRIPIFNMLNSKVELTVLCRKKVIDDKLIKFNCKHLNNTYIYNLICLYNELKKKYINVVIIPTQTGDFYNFFLVIVAKLFKKEIISFGHGWNQKISSFKPYLHPKQLIKCFFYLLSDKNLIYEANQAYELKKYFKKKKFIVFKNTIHIEDKEKLRLVPLNIKNQIVYIGKLNKEKRINVLLYYFYKLKERLPELNLVVIGDGVDRKLIEKENNDIIFLGRITNNNIINQVLNESICVFIPGKIGLVANHSIGLGCPIIGFKRSNKVYHAPEVNNIIDGVTGFLINENVDELYKKILFIRLHRKKFKQSCIKYYDENITSENMVALMLGAIVDQKHRN